LFEMRYRGRRRLSLILEAHNSRDFADGVTNPAW
jgi:hypothetical protein